MKTQTYCIIEHPSNTNLNSNARFNRHCNTNFNQTVGMRFMLSVWAMVQTYPQAEMRSIVIIKQY